MISDCEWWLDRADKKHAAQIGNAVEVSNPKSGHSILFLRTRDRFFLTCVMQPKFLQMRAKPSQEFDGACTFVTQASKFFYKIISYKISGSADRSSSVKSYMSRINCLSHSRCSTFRRANMRCCVLIMTSAGNNEVCPNSLA